MNIYLARPIDQAHQAHPWVLEAHQLLQYYGFTWFDPGAAFVAQGELTTWIDQVNLQALTEADAVLALLPAGTPRIGVPVEVARAVEYDVPVVVVHDARSYTLAGLGVPVFGNVAAAVAHLEQLPPKTDRYQVKVTGSGRFQRAYTSDAGYDLAYSGDQPVDIPAGQVVDLPADVVIEWPAGMWALLIGRSSTFKNRGLLVNPSVIDAGYRGEMFVIVRNVSVSTQQVNPGERLAQLVPFPTYALGMDVERVSRDQLSASDRGVRGFGSSGV